MEKFKLRPYQDAAVQHGVAMLQERGNSLIVAGTGAGKTIMLAAVIGRFFNGFYATHKRKPHVLVLVHRTEIHDQNHSKFTMVCPEIQTSEITSSRKSLHGNVHFGMVQTVANLLNDFAQAKSYFDLIVIDEAHHAKASTYEGIIDWNEGGNPGACLLGVTATPNRGDKLPLVHLFDNFNQITTKFLIDSHYLVRPRFVDLSPCFSVSRGKKGIFETEKGHLSKNVTMDEAGQELIAGLCEEYVREKEAGKSVIFAPSHEFCGLIFEQLKNMGRSPAYLSLGLDDETRREEIARFEDGECEELINVDICTEGYDFPQLRNVVDFDTNGTHGQWVQKVGRGLRTAHGKTSCTVLDFGGNIGLYPHGVETDVDLDGVVKREKGERLTEEDFFREKKQKTTAEYETAEQEEYTPYHPPYGFETVNDKDFGIVFVACAAKADSIIAGSGSEYHLFVGNKVSLKKVGTANFNTCMAMGVAHVGETQKQDKPIGDMQIKLLAPEYPTTALDWYGANCCLCWKTWKGEICTKVKPNC